MKVNNYTVGCDIHDYTVGCDIHDYTFTKGNFLVNS